MRKFSLILLSMLPLLAFGQYPSIQSKITLKSDTWKDTIAFLALYKGNQLLVTDTFRFNEKGKAELDKSFTVGQYELVFANRGQKPLLINETRIKLKHEEDNINYGRSNENTLYSAFLSIQNELNNKRNALEKDATKTVMLQNKIEQLESKRVLFLSMLDKRLKNTLAEKIILATCQPNDLAYYQQNINIAQYKGRDFFKECSLNDPNLLFSQIFHERVKFYLTQVVSDNPELLLKELSWMLEVSKTVEYNYQYMINYWLGFYQRNKKPTSELAFEFLVNKYVLAGQTPWIEDWKQQRLEAQVQFLKNQKLGDIPPVIELYDTEDKKLDYESKREKYQLLLIWDPNCSHCKEEVPGFARVYYKYRKKGFSTVAIYDQINKEDWVSFISEHDLTWMNGADIERKGNLTSAIIISETPTVLLLNKKGEIVKKRFTAEELDVFLKSNL